MALQDARGSSGLDPEKTEEEDQKNLGSEAQALSCDVAVWLEDVDRPGSILLPVWSGLLCGGSPMSPSIMSPSNLQPCSHVTDGRRSTVVDGLVGTIDDDDAERHNMNFRSARSKM